MNAYYFSHGAWRIMQPAYFDKAQGFWIIGKNTNEGGMWTENYWHQLGEGKAFASGQKITWRVM